MTELVRVYSSLKAGKTWEMPVVKVSAKTTEFVLMLTPGDADRDNDSWKIVVPLVR